MGKVQSLLRVPKENIMKLHMPIYKNIKWNGYNIYILPDVRNELRRLPLIARIIPYFWDDDINLDMMVTPPKNKWQGTQAPLQYRWELWDSDDNVVRTGGDSYEFHSFIRSLTKIRKQRAIEIGFLKSQQCYRLIITFTDSLGNMSERFPIVTFTIKDRDELKMQMFLAVFAVIAALVFSLLFRGCG